MFRIKLLLLCFYTSCVFIASCYSEPQISKEDAEKAHKVYRAAIIDSVNAYYDLNDIFIKKWNTATDVEKAQLLEPAKRATENLSLQVKALQASVAILKAFDDQLMAKLSSTDRSILEGHRKLMEKAQTLSNSLSAYGRINSELLKGWEEKSSGKVSESAKLEWYTSKAVPLLTTATKLKSEIDQLIILYNKADKERPR